MAAIFITVEVTTFGGETYGGAYKDVIAVCPHTGDIHIFCRGQRRGRSDNIVQNNDIIHVFSRRRATDLFTYWGKATKEWTNMRVAPIGVNCEVQNMSYFKLIIKSENVVRITVPRNINYNGSGCLKLSCLAHINANMNIRRNMMECFQII